jgi:EF-P beta-lysylation protein EpmB
MSSSRQKGLKRTIISRTEPGCQDAPWKRELAAAITRPEELLDMLGLDRALLPAARAASKQFRLLVPRGYADLMEPGKPDDPLLRQVLPLADELRDPPGFCADPVGDSAALRTPGLLQKYRGRALLLVTGACAVHCRYCFRRHFAYGTDSALPDRSAGAVARLAREPSISEVILSGGDPLMLDDTDLAALIGKLAAIPHLRRLRLHTRMPVVLPSRITDSLCRMLAESRLRPVVVIHANHARELQQANRPALDRLRDAGVLLLNQSVLLRGVNDCPDRLVDLSQTLFDFGVLPYYLHLLDRVSGAAHFDRDEQTATRMLDRIRARLPGYLVPQLVRELEGQPYKVPVEPRLAFPDPMAEKPYGVTPANSR